MTHYLFSKVTTLTNTLILQTRRLLLLLWNLCQIFLAVELEGLQVIEGVASVEKNLYVCLAS